MGEAARVGDLVAAVDLAARVVVVVEPAVLVGVLGAGVGVLGAGVEVVEPREGRVEALFDVVREVTVDREEEEEVVGTGAEEEADPKEEEAVRFLPRFSGWSLCFVGLSSVAGCSLLTDAAVVVSLWRRGGGWGLMCVCTREREH